MKKNEPRLKKSIKARLCVRTFLNSHTLLVTLSFIIGLLFIYACQEKPIEEPIIDVPDGVVKVVKVTPTGNNIFPYSQRSTLIVEFAAESGVLGAVSGSYTITDYSGTAVKSGALITAAFGDNRRATVDITGIAKTGWFKFIPNITVGGQAATLYFPGTEWGYDHAGFIAFAIVPDVTAGNPKFSLDVAASSYQYRNLLPVSAMAQIAAYSGAGWIRERYSADVLPAKNQPNAARFTYYANNAAEFKNRSLNVLTVYQNAPVYSLKGLPSGSKMPFDLFAMYDFARYSAMYLNGKISAYEIWNEHDISAFGGQRPPDHYAALAKASSLGYLKGSEGGTPPLRLLGPIARDPNFLDYGEIIFKNGVAHYLDAYSFHTYKSLATLESVFNNHKRLAQEYMPSKPIWLTETSLALTRNGTIADFDKVNKDQIEYLIKVSVLALKNGLDKSFIFLLRPYVTESGAQFGLLRTDHTPYGAYAAFAAMCKLLPDGYTGQMADSNNEVLVFGDMAVVYSKSGNSSVFTLPGGVTNAHVFDCMGNEITLTSPVITGKLPVYIRASGWEVTPPEASPQTEECSLDLETVLFSNIDNEYVNVLSEEEMGPDALLSTYTPRDYKMPRGQHVPFEVEVYNFSNHTKEVYLTPQMVSGAEITLENRSVTVPPMDKAVIDAGIYIFSAAEVLDFKIDAISGGVETAPSFFRVRPY